MRLSGIVGSDPSAAPSIGGARLPIVATRRARCGALPTLPAMPKIDLERLRASRRAWFDHSAPRVGGYGLQWLWTALFCAALALPFTVLGSMSYARVSGLGWVELYGRNLGVCAVIGGFIHGVFDLLRWRMGGFQRIRHWTRTQRTLFFSGIPLACTFVAWPVGIALFAPPVLRITVNGGGGRILVGMVLLAVMLTLVFHHFFAVKHAQLDAERRAAEAQLRLLQGQIEPHFLFNTLAGVISLIDPEPAKAKQMLQDFTEYLRSSLAVMRSGDAPLAQELDLAEHYLRLLGTRMDERLRWHIEADEAARRVPVPPLLLQPLVENAIHHGLEPLLEGGSVSVQARLESGELVLQVQDDGRGLDAPPRPGGRQGAGVALANVRSRLQARYGTLASLELQPASPGTRAVIRLPVDPSFAPGEPA